jgi:hypothetical protein
MGILDDLFGKKYAIEQVPSAKEMMDNALSFDTKGTSELEYIEYPRQKHQKTTI